MTVTVITGCSTGIGYATALRLATDGHTVVATMRNPDASDLGSVAKEKSLALEVKPLDVNDDASVDELFADVLATHGHVDVLVNNAGLGHAGVVEETSIETFRSLMETNFFGVLRCTQAVLPSMRERGSGWIVNVSSQSGRFAIPVMGPYCASKWALEAVSESLASEVAPFGLNVALIEPGAIMTAIWGKGELTPPAGPYSPARARLGKVVMTDVARASNAEEVADCIAEAITTSEPRLRWLVGQGAARNVGNRAGFSDEDYIRLWNSPDEEFMPRMFAEPGSV